MCRIAIALLGYVNNCTMPPKARKKGKKKGKGKAKKDDGGELSVEEMYKRTLQEVGSLKEQLAERKEYARQSRASEDVMRERVEEVKDMVLEEQITKKEIASDLTRQYKTMQSEKDTHISYLEAQVKRLKINLEYTKSELVKVEKERDDLKREKEHEVSALTSRLQAMERSYDTIIQDVLNSLCGKMEVMREKWNIESRDIELKTQQILLEFGT